MGSSWLTYGRRGEVDLHEGSTPPPFSFSERPQERCGGGGGAGARSAQTFRYMACGNIGKLETGGRCVDTAEGEKGRVEELGKPPVGRTNGADVLRAGSRA